MGIYNYDVLCHHGILGMKWGIRRFQNKDGSLTPAGQKRYRDYLNKNDNGYKVVEEQSKNLQQDLDNYKNARENFSKASAELFDNYEGKFRDAIYDNDYYGLQDKGINLDYDENRKQWTKYEDEWAQKITDVYNSFDKVKLQNSINNFNKAKEEYLDSEKKIVEKLIGKVDYNKSFDAKNRLELGLDLYMQKADNYVDRFKTYSMLADENLVPESYIKEYKGSPYAVPSWYGLQFID